MTAQQLNDYYKSVTKGSLNVTIKAEISRIAKSYGVTIRSGRCRNCYLDALLECYRLQKMKEKTGETTVTRGGRFVFLQMRPVSVAGRTYSTLTPESVIRKLFAQNPRLAGVLYRRIETTAKAEEVAEVAEPEPVVTEKTAEQVYDEITTPLPTTSDTDDTEEVEEVEEQTTEQGDTAETMTKDREE